MKIVEYKKHLVNGCIIDPEFIVIGGYFHNPLNNTWVGTILDESERLYYVPDSIIELDRSTLINRQQSIHNSFPFKKLSNLSDPHSQMHNFTDEDIVEWVDNFINSVN